MEKIKRIVSFYAALKVNGGGERLILEGLRAFTDMGLDAILLVFTQHEDVIFEGVYKPRIVSAEFARSRAPFSVLLPPYPTDFDNSPITQNATGSQSRRCSRTGSVGRTDSVVFYHLFYSNSLCHLYLGLNLCIS